MRMNLELSDLAADGQTHHARRRLRQRGIGSDQVAGLMRSFDRDRPVGNGCSALTLSRQALLELKADGWAPALLDRIQSLAIVVANDGAVVTVLRQYSDRRGRRYRRGWK